MKRLQLIRKKLLPLFISAAVAGCQISVAAADFSDTLAVSETGQEDDVQCQAGNIDDISGDSISGSSSSSENISETGDNTSEISGTSEDISDTDGLGADISDTDSPDTETLSQISEEDKAEDEREDTGETINTENLADSQNELFGDGNSEADITDDGIDYIKGRPLTEEEEKEQLAPFDTLTSYSTAVEIGNDTDEIPMGRAVAYPSYYNAAEQGYVTPVKDQDPYGMCWAFGMASLLETSLLAQGLGTYDLSEEHLAYFFANRSNDPLGNTAGDVNHHYGTDDYGNIDYHEGGNDLLASMFLSTWSGMTTEDEVPLATDATHTQKTGVMPSRSSEYHTAAYLKNAYFSDYSVSAMKKLLTANHSVTVMYNAQNKYYNASTGAYSYPTSTKSVNHVVTVVGWDDDYKAANFRSASKVTSDGAWIVKNSWGTDWGKDGYFYMSYGDKSVCELVAAMATDQPEYSNNYFYDGTSGLGSISLYSGEKLASVFKATAGKGKAETLGEVTLASMTANSSFTVQVYTNLKKASDPTSGTPAYSKPVSCKQTMAGIQTFKVPEVLISQNSLYSVVVTNAANKTAKYYVEASVDYGWCSFSASISAGQSYIYRSSGKKWSDTRNFGPAITPRIKVHTKTLDSAARMSLSSSSLSLDVGEKRTLKAFATRKEMTSQGITWVSSDTNVAAVSKSGVITAKHPGTAMISCYGNGAKGIKASCKIIVKLKKTTGIKVAGRAYNRIRIAWSAVPGCNRYVIYRSENGGKETKLTSVKSDINNWLDTSAKTGRTYTYRVRAAYVCSGKTTVYGALSDKVSAKAELGKVTAVAEARSGPCNVVSWNRVSGAGRYRIYRKTASGSFQCIKEVENTRNTYHDFDIQGITSYTYAVRACCLVDGKKVFSSYVPGEEILSYPSQQKISKIVRTACGLRICWKKQAKADCYQIYRKTKNTSWKKIGTVSGGEISSFEDKTAKKGTTYYYAVRAGVKISTGKVRCGSYAAKSAKR